MVTHALSVTSTGADSRCQVVPGLAGADTTAMAPGYPAHRGREPIPWRCERLGPNRATLRTASDRCGATPAARRREGEPDNQDPAGLLTDKYELTMLAAALRDGSANRPTTFEVFARRLPTGRRYGVVAGTGRLLEALPQFRFDADACELLAQFLDPATVRYLREFRFRGDIDGYAEGELYFPGSPVLSVRGSFAECVLLETLVLSIFNHDTAIASAAARMVSAAGGAH